VLLPRGLHPIVLESTMNSEGTDTLERKWITSESITAVTGLLRIAAFKTSGLVVLTLPKPIIS
jgi:hypothetical protein